MTQNSRRDKPSPRGLIYEGQIGHVLWLVALVLLVFRARLLPGFSEGSLFGIPTTVWLVLLIGDTVLHQIMVWFCWRTELHLGAMTALFGPRAFALYRTAFAILFGARWVLITLLAIANRGTLPLDPIIGYIVAAVIAVPTVYLFYSVKTYFGFERAFGIDHFKPKEARNWPLVREGIFRFTPNAMYVFGIGGLWIPGFLFQSTTALVAAAFSHIYIWIHYFYTEKPDMKRIYGEKNS